MAAPSRRSGASLIEALRASPERFEFVQAVRILERAAARRRRAAGDADVRPADEAQVGLDNDPGDEAVLLRAAMDLVFPTSEVASLTEVDGRSELVVNVMGLNGPSGVLPLYYSQLILEGWRDKNSALRDFFDLFNHRALSLFARAAEKYRPPLAYQGADLDDSISVTLLALIGLRQEAMRRRQSVSDEALIFYGGNLSRRVASAGALEQMLSEYLESPARVTQFVGRWARLPVGELSRLGGPARPGPYSQLGADTVVGSMVYDVQGAFRVGLGPLTYAQFLGLLPDGGRMADLAALTRTYAGPALSFDVQLTLKASEIPALQLTTAAAPRLGWTTWLPTSAPREDASDAVFRPADG
jgi:type VI secretion system protein ImpH